MIFIIVFCPPFFSPFKIEAQMFLHFHDEDEKTLISCTSYLRHWPGPVYERELKIIGKGMYSIQVQQQKELW